MIKNLELQNLIRAKERIQNIFSKNKKDKISESELENLINEGKVPVEIKNNF